MRSAYLRRAAATLVALGLATAPAASARESSGARLTFVRGGSIFVASADGRSAKAYLRTETEQGSRWTYYSPAWSPDGSALAVVVGLHPPARSNLKYLFGLTLVRGRAGSPSFSDPFPDATDEASWSPDGRRLVYCSVQGFDTQYGASCDLEILDLRTKRSVSLTREEKDGAPAWSPDGKLIAFWRQPVGSYFDPETGDEKWPPSRLYVLPPTGGQPRPLTQGEATNPSWSPDGKYIAFDNRRRIGIVARGGGTVRFITTGTDPAWSPDGRTIAFVRKPGVWLVGRDGRGARLAARNGSQPAWQPSP